MGSSARAANVGYGQECPDEACQPIVGIGDVMEEVELKPLVETPGNKVGFQLPEVVVELVPSLNS